MYASYLETYQDSVKHITASLERLEKGDRCEDVTVIHKNFKDAEKCLRSMELESKSNMEQRKQVQGMQRDLKALSARFDREIAAMHKRGLLGDIASNRAIQKRLMETEAKIEDGTRMVKQSGFEKNQKIEN